MNHPIHPMLVHFPIALLFVSFLFDLIFFLTGREEFKKGGFWLLLLGWVAGLAATLSGVLSEDLVEKAGVPKSAIERHEFFAFMTLGLFAGLILVRAWIRNRWSYNHRLIYIGGALVGLFILATTGYWGGDLVYRYGAGVQPNPAAAVASPKLEKSGAGG